MIFCSGESSSINLRIENLLKRSKGMGAWENLFSKTFINLDICCHWLGISSARLGDGIVFFVLPFLCWISRYSFTGHYMRFRSPNNLLLELTLSWATSWLLRILVVGDCKRVGKGCLYVGLWRFWERNGGERKRKMEGVWSRLRIVNAQDPLLLYSFT